MGNMDAKRDAFRAALETLFEEYPCPHGPTNSSRGHPLGYWRDRAFENIDLMDCRTALACAWGTGVPSEILDATYFLIFGQKIHTEGR